MKKLIILLIAISGPLFLQAQTTIGKSKDGIRKIIQSNPSFKLLAGDNCDTLVFAQTMQTIFSYKDNICYKSVSVMPLEYMPDVVQHMTEDLYKKIKDNVWIDAKETIKVQITADKKNCFVETTFFDKSAQN